MGIVGDIRYRELIDVSNGGGNEASCVVRRLVLLFRLSSIMSCVATPTDITPALFMFVTYSNVTGSI